jgi:hypothetical protein
LARYRRHRRRKPLSEGQRAALEHIQQGQRLSAELGGLDKDVKIFLFSRSGNEVARLLDAYEAQFGAKAREYAEDTIPAWRCGTTQMSGLVAERLFRLLPRFMNLSDKLNLAKRLWEHTSPSSNKTFVVPPDVAPESLRDTLTQHLEQVVVPHAWPRQMEARFEWLAAEDVQAKQRLMNVLREEEARVLATAIADHVTPLINHLQASQEHAVVRASHAFAVGKHRVLIEFRKPAPARPTTGCLVPLGFLIALASAGIAMGASLFR